MSQHYLPVLIGKDGPIGHGMKQRPEGTVAAAVVEFIEKGLLHVHGHNLAHSILVEKRFFRVICFKKMSPVWIRDRRLAFHWSHLTREWVPVLWSLRQVRRTGTCRASPPIGRRSGQQLEPPP